MAYIIYRQVEAVTQCSNQTCAYPYQYHTASNALSYIKYYQMRYPTSNNNYQMRNIALLENAQSIDNASGTDSWTQYHFVGSRLLSLIQMLETLPQHWSHDRSCDTVEPISPPNMAYHFSWVFLLFLQGGHIGRRGSGHEESGHGSSWGRGVTQGSGQEIRFCNTTLCV